jgi:hypothetical protein
MLRRLLDHFLANSNLMSQARDILTGRGWAETLMLGEADDGSAVAPIRWRGCFWEVRLEDTRQVAGKGNYFYEGGVFFPIFFFFSNCYLIALQVELKAGFLIVLQPSSIVGILMSHSISSLSPFQPIRTCRYLTFL